MPESPGSFVRRHPLGAFYGLALLVVCGVMAASLALRASGLLSDLWAFLQANRLYPNVVSIGRFALGEPLAWLIFLFAAAPTLAAVAVVLGAEGLPGLKALLARLSPFGPDVPRRDAARAWALLLGLSALGTAGYLWSLFALGTSEQRAFALDSLGGAPLAVLAALALGPFLDEGGLLEELGWRGFALPLLLARGRAPLAATAFLAVLWWAWHLPREVVGLLAGLPVGRFLLNQALFLLLCLALSIVMTYFFQRTGGSALTAILVHGVTNVWSKALAGPLNERLGTDSRTLVVLAAALVVLVAAGPALGRPAATPRGDAS
ncbi:MAG: CPBP family intramembrane metalloprotease [Thermoanaerobaculia bacterium]|nr:CPBP family intramembrane metalloprotease [Thermoanaerobaculia bacterium]